MLNSARLINFMSHKDSKFDFCSGVNVIIGESDKGKSAVLHGLNWACNNKPVGDSFRSWWGGETFATVDLIDGKVHTMVSRSKEGPTKNLYHLTQGTCLQDSIETDFKAFGQSVPEEIQTALNLSDINWQGQFDPHFLLSSSPGEVARKFNEVASLDKIDSSSTNINRMGLKNHEKIRTLEAQLEELIEQAKQYEYLEGMEEQVTSLEVLESEIEELESDADQLKQLRMKYKEVRDEAEASKHALEVTTSLQTLIDQDIERKSIVERSTELFRLLEEHETLKNAGDYGLSDILKELEELTPDECPTCGTRIGEVRK